ncbi:MAG: desulfoferrodoxin [Chloroflexi bacterium]|nr:desulfoferrodoxin [Chloroflexota bacterium]
MANETGKRYTCSICNAEFVVTRGGDGEVKCCGEPMQRKA